MANEMHKLFEQSPDEDEIPEYEEIGVINVARLIGTRKIPDVRSYRADEIPDLEAAAKLFGSGEYLFVARRLHALRVGPDEEKPAGSIYRKRIHVIGSEHGPWIRMLDRAPAPPPPNGAPVPNGQPNGYAAPAAPLPGMPPPEVASSPMFMMMWMMHQQGMRDSEARREQQTRDEAARREQIERDRIAADKSEAEARRQHEMTMAMLAKQGDGAGGVPQMFGQFAEVLGKVHAPPPAPAPPAPSVGALVGDLETLAKAAKLLKGNDDIELVKAIGEGLGGLAGLGSLFGKGGGLSGAPAT